MGYSQEIGYLRSNRRRSRLEIYLDVLRMIYDGERKPTRIMHGANLSWWPTRRIFESLVSQGLVREVDASGDRDGRTARIYEITEKGQTVVRYFSRWRDLLELTSRAR